MQGLIGFLFTGRMLIMGCCRVRTMGRSMHAASIWRLLRFTRLLRSSYFYEINKGCVSEKLLFFGTPHGFPSPRSTSGGSELPKTPMPNVIQKFLSIYFLFEETSRASVSAY